MGEECAIAMGLMWFAGLIIGYYKKGKWNLM